MLWNNLIFKSDDLLSNIIANSGKFWKFELNKSIQFLVTLLSTNADWDYFLIFGPFECSPKPYLCSEGILGADRCGNPISGIEKMLKKVNKKSRQNFQFFRLFRVLNFQSKGKISDFFASKKGKILFTFV